MAVCANCELLSMIPERFGRYVVINKLGQGGMAEVYLAEDPVMKRQVAIKVLPAGPSLDNTSSLRFYQEVETIATLEHSAIVPIYDVGEEEGRPFFVMRYMTGGKLSQHLAQGLLPIDKVIEIMRRLAGALDKAHRAGIVHRDLKPDNVLLDADGKVYLADFGIAKLLASNTALTTNQAILGTLEYMSPEQLQSEKVEGSSDIYALGVLLYHMLAGQPPYTGTLGEIIAQHLSPNTPNILDVRPDLPPECEQVIAQAMSLQKAKRYTSAMEMAEALAHAFGRSLDPSEPILPKWQQLPIATTPLETPDNNKGLTGYLPQPVLTTSMIIQRQLKRLPTWIRWALIVVPLLFLAYWGIVNVRAWLDVTPTAVPDVLATATATMPPATPTLMPTAITTPLPPLNDQGNVLRILNWSEGAILEVGGVLQRIPADGRVPITTTQQTITLQTDVSRLEMLLPDSTKFYLDGNTVLDFVTIAGIEGAMETAVRLQGGRMAIGVVGTPVTIIGPDKQEAQVLAGLTGIETGDAFRLVCLEDQCSFQGVQSETPIILTNGQAFTFSATNVATGPIAAQIEPYMVLLNPIATLTATPTETPTPTTTPTITPTPTPTIDATRMGPEVLEIGHSSLGITIEAVRFGDGPEVFIFAAGLQGGYSPNAVALADEMITYLSANLQLIPERATLYIIANSNPDSQVSPGAVNGRFNANGVDLNRNWDCNWRSDPWIISSRVEDGGGAEPYSEPETQALVNFIVDQEPTAVLFWMAHRQESLVSPGSCQSPKSRVSLSLSQQYAMAAGYNFYTAQDDIPDADLNGDASNSLDQQGIPSASVLLPLFEDIDWEENLAGMLAVLNDYSAPSRAIPLLTPVANGSTNTTCLQTVESRWMNSDLYAEFAPALGCALTAEQYPSATYQLYANGLMVWRRDTEEIYVLYYDGSFVSYPANLTVGAAFAEDGWHQGPMGYLWRTNLIVQRLLGEPINAEMGTSEFTLQAFMNGMIFYFRENRQNSYVLLPNTADVHFIQEK